VHIYLFIITWEMWFLLFILSVWLEYYDAQNIEQMLMKFPVVRKKVKLSP
jgi:hypothetical protein